MNNLAWFDGLIALFTFSIQISQTYLHIYTSFQEICLVLLSISFALDFRKFAFTEIGVWRAKE